MQWVKVRAKWKWCQSQYDRYMKERDNKPIESVKVNTTDWVLRVQRVRVENGKEVPKFDLGHTDKRLDKTTVN